MTWATKFNYIRPTLVRPTCKSKHYSESKIHSKIPKARLPRLILLRRSCCSGSRLTIAVGVFFAFSFCRTKSNDDLDLRLSILQRMARTLLSFKSGLELDWTAFHISSTWVKREEEAPTPTPVKMLILRFLSSS